MEAHKTTVPTKVCPRCRVQTQTLEERCPNCGKRYERPRVVKIAAILAAAAALGSATGLVLAALDDAGEQTKTQTVPAITFEQGARIDAGTSRAEVERRLGRPAVRRPAGRGNELPCTYYDLSDQAGIWQFCFRRDKVVISGTVPRPP
jgi:hypothetical protein